jgi:hypothetical protein
VLILVWTKGLTDVCLVCLVCLHSNSSSDFSLSEPGYSVKLLIPSSKSKYSCFELLSDIWTRGPV